MPGDMNDIEKLARIMWNDFCGHLDQRHSTNGKPTWDDMVKSGGWSASVAMFRRLAELGLQFKT